MLRMSTLFLRTLREDPADAEVASHRLLVRAGYIRRAAPGGFTWLPLGWIVYQNVERVVREEMNRAGFQEVHFPALLPREPYELSGRWTDYGDNVFRLKDRKGADMLLAPTHEEMFTLLVKDLYSSYKDLPLVIYQIQTKFRDEARPRAGLLRGREFVMKDSYSFDLTDEGLEDELPAPPRRLSAHLRSARPAVRDRVGDERGDGRIGERGVPRPDGRRRGLLRSLHQLRLRGQHRGGAGRGAAAVPYDDAPAGAGRRHARHADHPDAGRSHQQPRRSAAAGSRLDRGRHAEERDRQAPPSRRAHRTARRRRARRPRGRHEAPRGPARAPPRSDRSARPTSLRTSTWSRDISGPARWVPTSLPASATSSTRGSSTARSGSPAPTSPGATCSTSPPAATSSPTAPSRRPRWSTAMPAPSAARRWRSPAASRSATSSSSAASTPRRSGSTCSTRTASSRSSRWARTASACRARWPRSPR